MHEISRVLTHSVAQRSIEYALTHFSYSACKTTRWMVSQDPSCVLDMMLIVFVSGQK